MDNSYEQQAIDLVKQNEALKAQVNELRKCLVSESRGGIIKNMRDMSGRIKWYDKVKTTLELTPEQCLNSVKADAVDDAMQKFRYDFEGPRDTDCIEGFFDVITRELRSNN